MPLVKLTRSRQVSIPKELCEEMGLQQGDYLEITRAGDQLVLRPKVLVDRAKAKLSQLLEPTWERNRDVAPATLEADVDQAVAEVRASKDRPRTRTRH